MDISEFKALSTNGRTGIDYSFVVIGEVVEVPLLGRTPLRAQRSFLQKAKRNGWAVITRIKDGRVYALREA